MIFDATRPIYLQIVEAIKNDIVGNKIKIGDKLPSTRELAVRYGVNPNTVQRVYRELEQEGITYTKRGLGTFVCDSEEMVSQIKEEMANHMVTDFLNGMISLGFTNEEIIKYIKGIFNVRGGSDIC